MAHPIVVLPNYISHERTVVKARVSRQLVCWAIELGEFDLFCQTRSMMKAQVLANFVAEECLRF